MSIAYDPIKDKELIAALTAKQERIKRIASFGINHDRNSTIEITRADEKREIPGDVRRCFAILCSIDLGLEFNTLVNTIRDSVYLIGDYQKDVRSEMNRVIELLEYHGKQYKASALYDFMFPRTSFSR